MSHRLKLPGQNVANVQYRLSGTGGDDGDPVMNGLALQNSYFVAINGDDATAKPFRLDKPYLTINAAWAAAKAAGSGTLVMYPGTYSAENATLTAELGQAISIHAMGSVTLTNIGLAAITEGSVSLMGRLSIINVAFENPVAIYCGKSSTIVASIGLMQHHSQGIVSDGGNLLIDIKLLFGSGVQATNNGTVKIRVDHHLFFPGLGSGGCYEAILGGLIDVDAFDITNINGAGNVNSACFVTNGGGWIRARAHNIFSNSYACVVIDNTQAVPAATQSLFARVDIYSGKISNLGATSPIILSHDNVKPSPAVLLYGGVSIYSGAAVNSIARLAGPGAPLVNLLGHIVTNVVDDGNTTISGGALIVDVTILN